MRFTAAGSNTIAQIRIENYMITSNQTGQIKCLARCIKRNGSFPCIFADRLKWNMMISIQYDIRPDFIRYNNTIIILIHLHRFFQFFKRPDSSSRVMRITEDGYMNLMLLNFFIHIFIIHSPDSFFIPFQFTVDNLITGTANTSCKPDVSWAMHKNAIPRTGKCIESREQAAQNAIFISYAFLSKSSHLMPCFVPVND